MLMVRFLCIHCLNVNVTMTYTCVITSDKTDMNILHSQVAANEAFVISNICLVWVFDAECVFCEHMYGIQ